MFQPWKKLVAAMLLAGVVLLSTPSQADAVFTIRFASASGGALVITDNGAGDSDTTLGRIDPDGTNAAVIAFQTASGFTIQDVSTAFSIGANLSVLTDTQTNVIRAAGGPDSVLVITTGNDTFNLPGGIGSIVDLNGSVSFTLTAGTPVGGLVDQIVFDNFIADVPPVITDLATPNGIGGAVTLNLEGPRPPGVASGSTPTTVFSRSTVFFQVTNRSTLTLTAGAQVTGSTSSTVTPSAVPAPAGLVLLAAGAPLLSLAGLRCWRKRA